MKVAGMIQSPWLKKEDFATPLVMTIKGVSLEEVGRGENRWVLWVNESTKALVLNSSKIRLLEAAYGGETDAWIGRKVRLSIDPSVEFGGRVVGGIRLETPPRPAGLAATPPPPQPAAPEFNDSLDDIPW